MGALKRAFNPVFLAKTDLMLSGIFGLIYFGPSIFTCSYLNKNEQSLQKRDECFLNNIFRCPRCHKQLSLDVKCPHDVNFNLLSADGLSSSFRCIECGFIISEHDGIFDFR